MKKYDIVVLGSGPGGYVSAIIGAQNGLSVCLIEKEELGGTCLNWGCIPTKALSVCTEKFNVVSNADIFGIEINDFNVNISKIIDRKDIIVSNLRKGLEHLICSNGIEIIKGNGVIEDNNHIKIQETQDLIEFKNLIIASGGESILPDSFSSVSPNVVTAKKMLSLKEIPKKLLIIGGGVIGCEFAAIYSELGSEITIVESSDKLMFRMDSSISKEIERVFKRKKIKLLLNNRVNKILEKDNLLYIELEQGINETGYDKVLFAIGTVPYSELAKNIEVKKDEKGSIIIDDNCKTNIDHIYAVGDVTGKMDLAHVAYRHAYIAVQDILGNKAEIDYYAVPGVVFTHPEIAYIGFTEEEAQEKTEIKTAQFPLMALGRMQTLGERIGFVKMVVEKETDKILGVHILGHNASELIAEAAVYVTNGMKLKDVSDIIHAHPTMSESLSECALLGQGKALHMPAVQRM